LNIIFHFIFALYFFNFLGAFADLKKGAKQKRRKRRIRGARLKKPNSLPSKLGDEAELQKSASGKFPSKTRTAFRRRKAKRIQSPAPPPATMQMQKSKRRKKAPRQKEKRFKAAAANFPQALPNFSTKPSPSSSKWKLSAAKPSRKKRSKTPSATPRR